MMDFFVDYVAPIFLTILLILATIVIGGIAYSGFKDGFTTKTVTIEERIETQVQENTAEVE